MCLILQIRLHFVSFYCRLLKCTEPNRTVCTLYCDTSYCITVYFCLIGLNPQAWTVTCAFSTLQNTHFWQQCNYCNKWVLLAVLLIFDSTCCNHGNIKSCSTLNQDVAPELACLCCETFCFPWFGLVKPELKFQLVFFIHTYALSCSGVTVCPGAVNPPAASLSACRALFFFFCEWSLAVLWQEDGWMGGGGEQTNGERWRDACGEAGRGGGYVTLRFRSASMELVWLWLIPAGGGGGGAKRERRGDRDEEDEMEMERMYGGVWSLFCHTFLPFFSFLRLHLPSVM